MNIITFDAVSQTARQYIKPSDFKIVKMAYDLAAKAHADQKRRTGEPYIQHLLQVCLTLIELRLDPATLAAAFLHDVVEDTPSTLVELKKRFGRSVANLVDGVTKLDAIEEKQGFLSNLFGHREQKVLSQRERRLESLRKMLLATSKDVRVVLIKLADRLHNMQTIHGFDHQKRLAIAEETLELYAPLAYRLGIGTLKGQLEDLSFAVLQPAVFDSLVSRIKREAADRERQVEKARRILLKVMAKAGIEVEIHARVKHLYSLYKKLARYDNDLSKIHDLVACRLIVGTLEECYQALGIIHQRWKPVDGRVKDYIASPKPNGYQSLHTTVKAVEDRPIEIQIRTRAMHEQAEYGVAAHWHYSEVKGTLDYLKRKVSFASKNEVAWVNELAKWQREVDSYQDLDTLMKIDFFGDRIFAYTPRGEVIDLPVGATPIDFAYAIHSEIGNHLSGAKVNGKMVRLQDLLHSGDTVEVTVQKKAWPKPDWLQETKTRHAKDHIKRALRKDE